VPSKSAIVLVAPSNVAASSSTIVIVEDGRLPSETPPVGLERFRLKRLRRLVDRPSSIDFSVTVLLGLGPARTSSVPWAAV